MLQLLSFSKKTIKNTLSIYVKFNRDTLSVDLDPHWAIREVKEFVAPQLGLQPNEVKIIFAGKELSDTTKLEVFFIFKCLLCFFLSLLSFCFVFIKTFSIRDQIGM